MKYLKQICILMGITFLAELIHILLPFPIPASIYGLFLLFILLSTKLLKMDDIRETAKFLIDFMPIMFIPAAVAIMDSWIELSPVLHAVIWITVLTTIIVMVLSGHVTQFVIKKKGE